MSFDLVLMGLESKDPVIFRKALIRALGDRRADLLPQIRERALNGQEESLAVLATKIYFELKDTPSNPLYLARIEASLQSKFEFSDNGDRAIWKYLEKSAPASLLLQVLPRISHPPRQESFEFLKFCLSHPNQRIRQSAIVLGTESLQPELFSQALSLTCDPDSEVALSAFNAVNAMSPSELKIVIERSIRLEDPWIVSSQKVAVNSEGAQRPTAGDEPCGFTPRGEGGRVPSFIEKIPWILEWVASFLPILASEELRQVFVQNTNHPYSLIAKKCQEALSKLDSVAITRPETISKLFSSTQISQPQQEHIFVSTPQDDLPSQLMQEQKAPEPILSAKEIDPPHLSTSFSELDSPEVIISSPVEKTTEAMLEPKIVSAQKVAVNSEGAQRPTPILGASQNWRAAGDDPCGFTPRGEGERVPPFIEKTPKVFSGAMTFIPTAPIDSIFIESPPYSPGSTRSEILPPSSISNQLFEQRNLEEPASFPGSQSPSSLDQPTLAASALPGSRGMQASLALQEIPVESPIQAGILPEKAFFQELSPIDTIQPHITIDEPSSISSNEVSSNLTISKSGLADSIMSKYPSFLTTHFEKLFQSVSPETHLQNLRLTLESLIGFLNLSFIQTYLFFSPRTPRVDNAIADCLRSNLVGKNALNILNQQALAIKPACNNSSFFTFSLVKLITGGGENPLVSLRELNEFSLDPPPELSECLEDAVSATSEVLVLFKSILENPIVIKIRDDSGEIFLNLSGPEPQTLFKGDWPTFSVPLEEIIIMSKDRSEALGLFPYFSFDGQRIVFSVPSKEQFNILIDRLEIKESFEENAF